MTTATAEREGGELTHRQILTILVGLLLGMFLAALDQNVVSTAIRTIADDLGGLSQQAWATTAFLITSTISTPLYGKLSDIYGRKPLFLTAISIFILGSVTCTFAQSMYQLAAFRALQGLGAGGLFSLALTILGDIVPPRERARYQGFFLAVFATSSVAGPVIGGLLAGAPTILGIDGWRWIFLINVPIGAVALVVVAKVLNLPHIPRGRAHRLAGRHTAGGRTRAAVARRRAGPRVGLGLRRVRRLLRARRTRAAALRARRALVRRRRPAAASTVPQQRVLAGHGGRRARRHDDVRRDRGAAAVPANRARGVADRERFPHAAAGRGDHDRLAALRPGHVAHRAVQGVPGGGHAAHAGRAGDPPLPDQRRHPVLGARPLHGDVRPRSGRLHADAGARGAERVARAGHGRGHGRPRSSGSSAARSARPCSSRSCSPRSPARSRPR